MGDTHRHIIIIYKEYSVIDRQRCQPGDYILLILIEAISATGEIISFFVILE